jgi:hypothetical protein
MRLAVTDREEQPDMTGRSADEIKTLAAALGLDAEGRRLLTEALRTQARIQDLDARKNELLLRRREAIIGLTKPRGPLTKYKIAKALGVSQTTAGKIVKPRPRRRLGVSQTTAGKIVKPETAD